MMMLMNDDVDNTLFALLLALPAENDIMSSSGQSAALIQL